MSAKTKPVPEGYHTITPSLIVKSSRKAIDFYKRAFGAQEREVHEGPGGRVMHAEIKIGSSILMLGDESPERGCLSAASLKGSPANFYLYVENADAVFNQAVKAGAQVKMPVADMFWGDRAGSVTDPFGFHWTIATHKEDPTPEQLKKGGEEFFAAMSQSKH